MDSHDLVAIHQLVSSYGHAVDGSDSVTLAEVFSEDAVFDTGPTGSGVHVGIGAIRELFNRQSPPHPAAHHVTNIFVYEEDGDVRVHSKFLTIDRASGALRSGDYLDLVVLTSAGWRIKERTIPIIRWV